MQFIKYLEEAIDSIYAQTYSNWVVIFWDNASTDNSATIANSYDDRVKYYLAPKTTSLGNARNLALKKAKGKYIAFLDSDDVSPEEFADACCDWVSQGVQIIGGCCGTTIEHMQAMIQRLPAQATNRSPIS